MTTSHSPATAPVPPTLSDGGKPIGLLAGLKCRLVSDDGTRPRGGAMPVPETSVVDALPTAPASSASPAPAVGLEDAAAAAAACARAAAATDAPCAKMEKGSPSVPLDTALCEQ